MVKMIFAKVIGGILICASVNISAQTRLIKQTGCALVDKNRPAQFISYEDRIEPTSKVKLRLHNNTNCSIIVETDDKYPMRLSKLSNGGVKLETVTTSQEGLELPLHYFIQDKQRQQAPKPAYGWGDSVFTYEILAGQSAAFTVPLASFKEKLDIAVLFNYVWEGNRTVGVGGVVHHVLFLADDLPKVAFRER